MRPRPLLDTEIGIDPAAMAVLSRRVSQVAGELSDAAGELRRALADVGLPPSDATVLDAAAGWLRDQVPGLDRRRAIAESTSSALVWQPALPGLVYVDPWALEHFATRDQVGAAARTDAARLQAGLRDGVIDLSAVTDISLNGNDPTFAIAFAGRWDRTG